MRKYEFAEKVIIINGKDEVVRQYPQAKLPEYATRNSAGADFFCAERVVIPPTRTMEVTDDDGNTDIAIVGTPVAVHTGIRACMLEDEALFLYNRSGNPKKRGLVLANSVGVVDADYYKNPGNDGEIMFSFYNFSGKDVVIEVGERIGQGVFQKFLRPDEAVVRDVIREGGHGHTGDK